MIFTYVSLHHCCHCHALMLRLFYLWNTAMMIIMLMTMTRLYFMHLLLFPQNCSQWKREKRINRMTNNRYTQFFVCKYNRISSDAATAMSQICCSAPAFFVIELCKRHVLCMCVCVAAAVDVIRLGNVCVCSSSACRLHPPLTFQEKTVL